MNKGREQSVGHLASLYTVVIGVALSSSIYQLIDSEIGLSSVTTYSLMLFLSFVALIFPFYHGAMRHLDVTYLLGQDVKVRSFALMLDFLLLFTHGVLFVVISMLLGKPKEFAIFIMIVLVLDTFWGFLAHLAFSNDSQKKPETSWAVINLSAFIILFLFSIVEKSYLKLLTNDLTSYCSIILLVMVVRTMVDYGKNWEFYFPDD